MTLQEFIEENRSEIEDHIRALWTDKYGLDDNDLEDWIMNDENLYNWALSSGVEL